MCCSVLQCVAVCCSVLQCVAVCCSATPCKYTAHISNETYINKKKDIQKWPDHERQVLQESRHIKTETTGWRRLIGSSQLQIIFHKRATKYRSLLRKMTYKDKGSYESSPPCNKELYINKNRHAKETYKRDVQKRHTEEAYKRDLLTSATLWKSWDVNKNRCTKVVINKNRCTKVVICIRKKRHTKGTCWWVLHCEGVEI